jgi:16S rRNA (guanine(1405)-N(7))-methyltransferase
MEYQSITLELIKLIKNKKELNSLDDSLIETHLLKYKNEINSILNKYTSFKQFQKSAVCKDIISSIRADLREIYGVFIKTNLNNFEKNIAKLNNYEDPLIEKILSGHQSSIERLNHYSKTYILIFNKLFEWGLNKKYSLIDLACGFNPFAYKYLPIKPTKYLASDLSTKDMSLINSFFKNTKIKGEAIALNLLSQNDTDILKNHYDVCFLFKALDSLESKSRHSSKKLISKINSDFFVISFPKKTIGGKKEIKLSKRTWFERFSDQNFSKKEVFEIENETFYLLKK